MGFLDSEEEYQRRRQREEADRRRREDDEYYYKQRREIEKNLSQQNYRNTSSNNTRYDNSSGSGFSALIVLGIIGFIIYKIFSFKISFFIKVYWVSIVTIIGICVACLIVCSIIKKVSKNSGLKKLFTTLALLAAVGLIGTVIYAGPVKTKLFFLNFYKRTPKLEQKTSSFYAHVTSDALNIRSEPSDNGEIVGQLFKDQRVEIIDKAGQWCKIKSGNFEGYVYSDFLQFE